MRHKIVILLMLMLFLTGCLYNLNNFVIPDDEEFIAVIESLDTPSKICIYMQDNFEWVTHWLLYSPYQMWLANVRKAGDCNDFACFAVFVAHYHGYEVYQIRVRETFLQSHILGVFIENGFYTSSSNMDYYPWLCDSFEDVVNIYRSNYISYKVYDYEMNVVEVGYGR